MKMLPQRLLVSCTLSASLAFAAVLAWVPKTTLKNLTKWPNLQRYQTRISERPAVQAAQKVESA